MLLLVVWIIAVMGFIAYKEKPDRDENDIVKRMIREAEYHKRHPEVKRSVKYMNAGYYQRGL